MFGMNDIDWIVHCDSDVFARIKTEESFQQIVTLARAVNALEFAVSAMVTDVLDNSPRARRSRTNSFLFGSAILYEALLLVQKMSKTFKGDDIFKDGLQTLLKDPTARRLQKSHMGKARNFAVFHYEPNRIGKMVESAALRGRDFLLARGNSARELYFPFADELAVDVLMGKVGYDQSSLALVMNQTRELADSFIGSSHRLISKCLKEWGFIKTDFPLAQP